MSNTVKLHRVLAANPDKVFRAFSNADALAAWFPPYGFICTIQEMDFKVGGKFRMAFINFTTGSNQPFHGEYLEIENNKKIQFTDQFDDANLPGQMITTIELHPVICGTEINILQENIPEAIPTAYCYLGWQESLDKLKRLVEPNIPDA